MKCHELGDGHEYHQAKRCDRNAGCGDEDCDQCEACCDQLREDRDRNPHPDTPALPTDPMLPAQSWSRLS